MPLAFESRGVVDAGAAAVGRLSRSPGGDPALRLAPFLYASLKRLQSRKPALGLATSHDAALALQMATNFATPVGLQELTQAILDQLDGLERSRRLLADQLAASGRLAGAEVSHGQAAVRSR